VPLPKARSILRKPREVAGAGGFVGGLIENKNASLGNFCPSGRSNRGTRTGFSEAMHLTKLFPPLKTGTESQAVSPSRSSKRATVIGCHRPPHDVSIPARRTAANRLHYPLSAGSTSGTLGVTGSSDWLDDHRGPSQQQIHCQAMRLTTSQLTER
jgi:hypothetical protein